MAELVEDSPATGADGDNQVPTTRDFWDGSLSPESNAPIDKNLVWDFLKTTHPEIARRMTSADTRLDGTIVLDGLPPRSRHYVWSALQRWKPSLARLLKEHEGIKAARQVFGATIAIDTDDLVDATWKSMLESGDWAGPAGQRTRTVK